MNISVKCKGFSFQGEVDEKYVNCIIKIAKKYHLKDMPKKRKDPEYYKKLAEWQKENELKIEINK